MCHLPLNRWFYARIYTIPNVQKLENILIPCGTDLHTIHAVRQLVSDYALEFKQSSHPAKRFISFNHTCIMRRPLKNDYIENYTKMKNRETKQMKRENL